MERLHALEQRVAKMEAERTTAADVGSYAIDAINAAVEASTAPRSPVEPTRENDATYWRQRAYDAQAAADRAVNQAVELRARLQRIEAAARGEAP